MTSLSSPNRPEIDESPFEDPYAPALPPTQDELPAEQLAARRQALGSNPDEISSHMVN